MSTAPPEAQSICSTAAGDLPPAVGLPGCLRDLRTVFALPAIWNPHDRSQIAGTLLDALLGMLRLDFAYARVSGAIAGAPIEVVRLAQRRDPLVQPQAVGRALGLVLTGAPSVSPLWVQNPIGEGHIALIALRLGPCEADVLVVGSRRSDFPTETEALVLRVAAHQAIIGLHETEGWGATESGVAFEEFVGRSAGLRRVLEQVQRVAPTDAAVLITGESGTGKELVARAIHDRSSRRGHALVTVNCASVPRELFESEFFGHVRGSFTGALRDRMGRFQLADEGTIFLDEVAEIPLELQGKLLRVLQGGQVQRVGEDQARQVDVRVIAATNRDPQEELDTGRFRRDLYYRLCVFPIHVPPLRERRTDIRLLAAHFFHFAARQLNRPGVRLTESALALLERHDWPGNVRELFNVIERAVILSERGPLRIDLVLADGRTGPASHDRPELPSGAPRVVRSQQEMQRQERDNVLAALHHTRWKVYGPDGAAALLGLKPTTLASRLKRLGIERSRQRPAS